MQPQRREYATRPERYDMSQEKAVAGAIHRQHAPSEWHRRLALALSAQLPENPEDARAVLGCVEALVETFLYPPAGAAAGEAQDRVLLFAGAPGAASNCRTR
jgi:hypothetical protein